MDRDTCKYAFKCSSRTVEGDKQDVYKDPVTDKGKKSKRGSLKLIRDNGTIKTVRQSDEQYKDHEDLLVEIFRDGEVLYTPSFQEIRERNKIDINSIDWELCQKYSESV